MGAGRPVRMAGQNTGQVNPESLGRRPAGAEMQEVRNRQNIARRMQALSQLGAIPQKEAEFRKNIQSQREGIRLGPGSARRHTY
jgi:hypothetical protein